MICNCFQVLAIFGLFAVLTCPGVVMGDRQMNITHFDNCEDFGLTATVHLSKVNYDVNATTGLVETVHGTYRAKFTDTSKKLLRLTVYSCGQYSAVPCKDSPQTYEIDMDCDRFMNDKSGPWHAMSSSMTLGICGDTPGEHTFIYNTLEASHMANYVDLNDPEIKRFAIRKLFVNTENNSTWACGYVSVDLVNV